MKSVFSNFLTLDFGVRQGSILSPHLFAIYVDDRTDCFYFGQKPLHIMYADDIMLIAGVLQKLLHKCEQELCWLGMSINVKKSCCLHVGPLCDVEQLPWVKELCYLDVYLVQSCHFRCTIYEHKKSFFRSVNVIYGKLSRTASDEVTLQLVFFRNAYLRYCLFRIYAFI